MPAEKLTNSNLKLGIDLFKSMKKSAAEILENHLKSVNEIDANEMMNAIIGANLAVMHSFADKIRHYFGIDDISYESFSKMVKLHLDKSLKMSLDEVNKGKSH